MGERLRLLIAEDEKGSREALVKYLSRTYDVSAAADGAEAIRMLGESKYDILLADIRMPGAYGDEVVAAARGIPAIVMTAYSDKDSVQKMLRVGAIDFIEKPINFKDLDKLIPDAISRWKNARGVVVKPKDDTPKPAPAKRRRQEAVTTRTLSDGTVIYMSGPMTDVYDLLDKYTQTDIGIVLTGETGTGKELAAKYIHEKSGRKGEFVATNCATINADLAESKLFGHEKGAFTDAKESQIGLIELANNGTLFLDEIESLSPDIQAKLLRVLQDHRIDRVGGGGKMIDCDFRLVCATNIDPDVLVNTGKFRSDFRFRIGKKIVIPPLRERTGEILPLMHYFIEKYSSQYKREPVTLSPEAESLVVGFDWPGNVRQLDSITQSVVVECDGTVGPDEIRNLLRREQVNSSSNSQEETGNLVQTEKERIIRALKKHNGNRTLAAKELDISRKTIQRKLKEWGIEDI